MWRRQQSSDTRVQCFPSEGAGTLKTRCGVGGKGKSLFCLQGKKTDRLLSRKRQGTWTSDNVSLLLHVHAVSALLRE